MKGMGKGKMIHAAERHLKPESGLPPISEMTLLVKSLGSTKDCKKRNDV